MRRPARYHRALPRPLPAAAHRPMSERLLQPASVEYARLDEGARRFLPRGLRDAMAPEMPDSVRRCGPAQRHRARRDRAGRPGRLSTGRLRRVLRRYIFPCARPPSAAIADLAVMFSDQDVRRTVKDVARARANIAKWKRSFGQRQFGEVETMEIFTRLDGQLAGDLLTLMMAKAVREATANEDARCNVTDCKATPRSRCSRCQLARYCSPDHVRRRCVRRAELAATSTLADSQEALLRHQLHVSDCAAVHPTRLCNSDDQAADDPRGPRDEAIARSYSSSCARKDSS